MLKKLTGILLALTLAGMSLAGCSNANSSNSSSQEKKTVKLAYVNWAEGVAMTNLAAAVLEDKMGYTVELTMADVAPVFSSLASGNTDAFMDVWLPVTHKDYMAKYEGEIVDLGVSFDDAVLGLVVPSYVDIDSIEDLNSIKDEVGNEIIGIDPGASMMVATEKLIEEYGLDYKLVTGSGPTMTAALSKAIDANKPIVVTGWKPHWKFAKWDLKVLKDPKLIYGDAEKIHKYSRKGLEEDMPEVAEFLKAFKMTETELGDLMGAIEEKSDTDTLEVARAWMNEHPDLINGWLAA